MDTKLGARKGKKRKRADDGQDALPAPVHGPLDAWLQGKPIKAAKPKHCPANTEDNGQRPQMVKLNVGGKMFSAPLTALTTLKDTFFESMFGGRWPLTPEEDGSFFIDRDPTGFDLILQCLTGDKRKINSISKSDMAAFIADIDYYGLPADFVEKWLGRGLKSAGEKFLCGTEYVNISDDKLTASCSSANLDSDLDDAADIRGTNIYGKNDHVLITLRISEGGRRMWIGLIEEPPDGSETFSRDRQFTVTSLSTFTPSELWQPCDMIYQDWDDIIEVELNCKLETPKLTVRNTTLNLVTSLGLPDGQKWRLYITFDGVDSSISIADSKWL